MPTLNVTYLPAEGHVLQLGVSSEAAYPEYWAVQDFINYSNGGYDEIVGNPALKPSHEYAASLTYVLHNKYVVRGWFSYVDDQFMQTLYQRGDELTETFRWVNFDFQQQAGLMASASLRLGGWYNGNFTATGLWMRQRILTFTIYRSIAPSCSGYSRCAMTSPFPRTRKSFHAQRAGADRCYTGQL